MPDSQPSPLESILRLCAAKAPEPWYPSVYAKETGTPRESLDPYLDQLRMAGLVRLTDWVAGHGQGYALTRAGEDVLNNPRQLARLVSGRWSLRAVGTDNRRPATGPSPWERGEAVREALLYPVQPVVTFGLIALNVGIWVLEFQYPQIEDLLKAGPVGILRGQWLRLLTTAFLHAWPGPMHLAMNMYALYALGQNAERIWGHWRYLTIYLIGAIGSTCLALITQPIPCIGASGAICGIFAAEAAWVYYHRSHLDPRLFFAWQRNFMINLVLIVFISFFPGVSWAGHLGGAIAGLAIALWLNYFRWQTGWRRSLQWLGIFIIPAVSIGLLIRTMNSSGQWQESRELMERQEMEVYLPGMRSAERKALKTYSDEVEPLLAQNASRRNSQDITKAIGQLDEELQEVRNKSELLRKRGSFATPFVERARQVRLQLTEALIVLLELSKECLQKGKDCTEKDEERMKQQEDEFQRVTKEWVEMLESRRSR
jgi:membrane associated rhomboid family serine protease